MNLLILKVRLIRLFYFLAFDLLCAFSKLFSTDPDTTRIRNSRVNEITANQKAIEDHLAKIYKDEKGGNFRAEKAPHSKEWKAEKAKVLQKMNLTIAALKMGKTYEELQALQNNPLKAPEGMAKVRQYCGLALIAYIAYKKLFN